MVAGSEAIRGFGILAQQETARAEIFRGAGTGSAGEQRLTDTRDMDIIRRFGMSRAEALQQMGNLAKVTGGTGGWEDVIQMGRGFGAEQETIQLFGAAGRQGMNVNNRQQQEDMTSRIVGTAMAEGLNKARLPEIMESIRRQMETTVGMADVDTRTRLQALMFASGKRPEFAGARTADLQQKLSAFGQEEGPGRGLAMAMMLTPREQGGFGFAPTLEGFQEAEIVLESGKQWDNEDNLRRMAHFIINMSQGNKGVLQQLLKTFIAGRSQTDAKRLRETIEIVDKEGLARFSSLREQGEVAKSKAAEEAKQTEQLANISKARDAISAAVAEPLAPAVKAGFSMLTEAIAPEGVKAGTGNMFSWRFGDKRDIRAGLDNTVEGARNLGASLMSTVEDTVRPLIGTPIQNRGRELPNVTPEQIQNMPEANLRGARVGQYSELNRRFAAMARDYFQETGQRFEVSGSRSMQRTAEERREIWQTKFKEELVKASRDMHLPESDPTVQEAARKAARGRAAEHESRHEHGAAFDIPWTTNRAQREWMQSHMRDYGLTQRLPQTDPFHIEVDPAARVRNNTGRAIRVHTETVVDEAHTPAIAAQQHQQSQTRRANEAQQSISQVGPMSSTPMMSGG